MKNFEFHNPTKIVFGAGTVEKLSTLVPQDARVLILYGGASAEKTGTLAEVRAALGQRSVREFGGIEPKAHGMTALGEHRDIDLARSRRILEAAL
jgi:NADP-dependent alcohol dehydrogenase